MQYVDPRSSLCYSTTTWLISKNEWNILAFACQSTLIHSLYCSHSGIRRIFCWCWRATQVPHPVSCSWLAAWVACFFLGAMLIVILSVIARDVRCLHTFRICRISLFTKRSKSSEKLIIGETYQCYIFAQLPEYWYFLRERTWFWLHKLHDKHKLSEIPHLSRNRQPFRTKIQWKSWYKW